MKVWKLFGIAIICLAMVSLIGCGEAEQEPEPETEAAPVEAELVAVDFTPTEAEIGTEIICAACGMKMTVTAEMPAVTYDGTNYFFCSAEEKAEFAAAPMKFLDAAEEVVDEAKEKLEEAAGQ